MAQRSGATPPTSPSPATPSASSAPIAPVARLTAWRWGVVFLAFAALAALGASLGVTSWRNQTVGLRGIRDASIDAPLPYRTAQAGINIDLTAYSSRDIPAVLDQLHALGFAWLRQVVRWSEVEADKAAPAWVPYDEAVRAVAADGRFRLILALDESPAWARKPGGEGSRFAPPASPAEFGRFAGSVAARYRGKVSTYQVWDEPNLRAHWGGLDPRPTEYVALLRSAAQAIRSADPGAPIMAAGLAPTTEEGPANISDVLFLQAMYDVGARDVMDAVAGKPYGFSSSPLDRTTNSATLNFSRLVLLREVMERNGDGAKPLFGTQFGWNSLPPGWTGAPSIWGQVDAATQELYSRQAYARAAQEWPWAGALILESWTQPRAATDDPIQGFAIAPKAAAWLQNGPLVPVRDIGAAPAPLADGLFAATDPAIRYAGEWRFGPLGADVGENADGSQSTFRVTFRGSSAALQVRRGDYVAYLYVTVDGGPANALPHDAEGRAFVLLTSPNRVPELDLIRVADGLDPARDHTLEVSAYLGYEQWAIAGIAISRGVADPQAPLIAGSALLTVIALIGLGWSARRVPWGVLRRPTGGLAAYGRRMTDIGVGIGVTFAAGLGMALTLGGAVPNLFRRDEPTVLLTILTAGLAYFSPGLLLSVISIGVLFLIIFNKPALGLCLTAFFAPFFLYPVQNYIRALPMVELVLILTTAAVLLRAALARLKRAPVAPSTATRLGGTLLDYVCLAFGVLAVISLAWSEQRAPALRELRIIVLEPMVFYFLIRITPLDRSDVLRLVDSLIGAGAVVCVLGLFGYFTGTAGVVAAEGGVRRLGSIYGSPNNLALFIGRCIPLAFAMALFPLSGLRRAAAAIVTLLMIGTVVLTQSAGALLFGIPAAGAVVLLAWDRRKGLALTALGISLLIIAGVIFLPRLNSALGGGRESSLARVNVWTSALNLIRERPITGAGLDQFLYLYRSRYILPDAYKEPDLSHPHDLVLDFWVRLGLGGVILLALFQAGFWRAILAAGRDLLKRREGTDKPPGDVILAAALCAGLMGSMADFLAHGLVDNSYFVVDLAYVFALTLAVTIWLRDAAPPRPAPLTSSSLTERA